ncbi:unnamed protein product [Tetraodon nigroviridis]|uniref:Chromosome 14 SCAF15003, whole genome shotgun sequence n=1 Tax=Tetraodon nigroviridis TaxID=99883 RepID=Q4RR07_TETNG|nr:unnamed protein product [Tetraodon nigroviridis]
MVTFAETTQVSPTALHEPPCLAATLSPGLRRKKMLWQNAVKHIIIQQELSAQVGVEPAQKIIVTDTYIDDINRQIRNKATRGPQNAVPPASECTPPTPEVPPPPAAA